MRFSRSLSLRDRFAWNFLVVGRRGWWNFALRQGKAGFGGQNGQFGAVFASFERPDFEGMNFVFALLRFEAILLTEVQGF